MVGVNSRGLHAFKRKLSIALLQLVVQINGAGNVKPDDDKIEDDDHNQTLILFVFFFYDHSNFTQQPSPYLVT